MRLRAVLDVMADMRADVGAPWTLRMMADRANMSPFHFNRVFGSVVGIPPRRFLAALRIDAAKHLLMNTDRSVTDVCFAVGYESLGTFTTRFTEVVGATPGRVKHLREAAAARALDHPTVPPHLSLFTDAEIADMAEIRGDVTGGRDGTVYVGVFPGRIPQGRPQACAILDEPGPYRVGPLPIGSYFVHAFAPASCDDVDDDAPLGDAMIGTYGGKVTVEQGRSTARADIELRELTSLDPPILVELSLVLRELQDAHRAGSTARAAASLVDVG